MVQKKSGTLCCIVMGVFATITIAALYLMLVRAPNSEYYAVVIGFLIGVPVVSFLFLIGWLVEKYGWKKGKAATQGEVAVTARREADDAKEGYDVFGPGVLELCTSATSFAEMRNRGYDWFRLIDSVDVDKGGKAQETCKYVLASQLEYALQELERVAPSGKYTSTGDEIEWNVEKEKEDPFQFWKSPLAGFMRGCLEWCKENGKDSVKIEFC